MKETIYILGKFLFSLFVGGFFFSLAIISYYYLSVATWVPSSMIREVFQDFVFIFLSLETVFIFSITLIYIHLFNRFISNKKSSHRFLGLLIEIISHKLGNFVSSQKVNLALLEGSFDIEPVARMRKSVLLMEQDLASFLENLEAIQKNATVEPINMDIHTAIAQERKKDKYTGRQAKKKIVVRGPNYLLSSREQSYIISLLMENALKYSKHNISVRLGQFRGRKYFFVSNDVSRQPRKGLGLGLSIVSHLCKKNDCKLRIRNSDSKFRVLVLFPKNLLKNLKSLSGLSRSWSRDKNLVSQSITI